MYDINGARSCSDTNTTYVSAAVERTEIRAVLHIVVIKSDKWFDTQFTAFHVHLHLGSVGQIYLAKIVVCGNCSHNSIVIDIISQLLEHVFSYHILTVTAKEHLVGKNIRTNLQLCFCTTARRTESGTITTTID